MRVCVRACVRVHVHVCMCVCVTELDSTDVLRWLVVHGIRRHPHYWPPGKQFVVTAQQIYLRDRAFYEMLFDFIRFLALLALILLLINMRNDYDIFLRNHSVYQQVFTHPHFKQVRLLLDAPSSTVSVFV